MPPVGGALCFLIRHIPSSGRTSIIDPINGSAHPTTFNYDVMNRLTGIIYPDGSTVSFGYDTRGRRTSATDQNNRTTTYAYDDADRLTSVTDAATHQTVYAYDTESNLTDITDANNHTTHFDYDANGRVTKTTFPSTLYETYAYDLVGNLSSKTDRKNQTIQYVYDALNRLTQKSYPDSTNVDYVYDLAGKIKQVTDPTGTYSFAYDNMGRLIGTTTQYSFLPGSPFTNAYTYDAASNRKSLTAPDSSITTYGYDTLNRLNGMANSWAGSFGFSYDALSRRTQLTRPNGINTNYGYDSVSRLLSVLHQSGSTTLDGASYTYDSAGNRQTKTNQRTSVTEGYTYDLIYQLTQVTQGLSTTESYSYDPVGNRLSSSGVPTYNYNSSNELTSTSTGSYTYDNNGSTLTDASGKSYTWDFENRLVQAAVPGTGTVAVKYDPFGRRIQKSGPLGITNYVYDGPNLLQEVDQSGSVVARYNGGPSIDEPLAESRSTSTSYYEADGLSSITSLTDSSSTIVATDGYDAFGKLSTSTGSVTNLLRYTGREFDLETGLYQYRARYYDQNVGRFLSEDPIGFSGSPDFYTYTDNNPVNWIDPYGLDRVQVCCRPLRFLKPLLIFRTWHHCYIQITGSDGTHTWGVLPGPGGQQPRLDDPRNEGGSCKDVSCAGCKTQSDDKTDNLRRNLENSEYPTGTCPSCGSNYHNYWWRFAGNNSNTYVYNMVASSGCYPPREPRAPGYNFAPGW